MSGAALAACSADPRTDEGVESGESDLTMIALRCRSGKATFDVKPVTKAASEGVLDTGSSKSSFVCSAPAKASALAGGDAGARADGGTVRTVLATCFEELQQEHDGIWQIEISQLGAKIEATVDRGEEGPLMLGCVSPSSSGDAGVGDASLVDAEAAVVPTYAEVKPILANVCGQCHDATFDSLDKVRKRRKSMIDALAQGRMPRGRPTWKDSADGKTLLAFLRGSTEL